MVDKEKAITSGSLGDDGKAKPGQGSAFSFFEEEDVELPDVKVTEATVVNMRDQVYKQASVECWEEEE